MPDTQEAPPAPTYYVVLNSDHYPIAVCESPVEAAQYMAARAVRMTQDPVADHTRAMSIVAVPPDAGAVVRSWSSPAGLYSAAALQEMAARGQPSPLPKPSTAFADLMDRAVSGAAAAQARDDERMAAGARGEPFFTNVATGPVTGLADFVPADVTEQAARDALHQSVSQPESAAVFQTDGATLTPDDLDRRRIAGEIEALYRRYKSLRATDRPAGLDSAAAIAERGVTPTPAGLLDAINTQMVAAAKRCGDLAAALSAACTELDEHAREYQHRTPASSLAAWRALAGGAA
jgi:hypothetical protein